MQYKKFELDGLVTHMNNWQDYCYKLFYAQWFWVNYFLNNLIAYEKPWRISGEHSAQL